jgi:hypothetical protein
MKSKGKSKRKMRKKRLPVQLFYISAVYNVTGQRNDVIGHVRAVVVSPVEWRTNVDIPTNMILDRSYGHVYDVGKPKRNVIENSLPVENVIKLV